MFINYKYFLLQLLDFIAVRNCEVCGKYLGNKSRRFEFICDRCFDAIPLAPEPEIIYSKFLDNFSTDDISISNAISLFSINENHDYIKLIYALKYYGLPRIGLELGSELAQLLIHYNKINYDAIIPVPIHKARLRERTYNQSVYIAYGIKNVLNIKVDTSILKRKIYTGTQTVLDKSERIVNLKNAFKINKKQNIVGKKFLIVDDVLTTGSTVNSCGECLLEAGAKSVDVASLVSA